MQIPRNSESGSGGNSESGSVSGDCSPDTENLKLSSFIFS